MCGGFARIKAYDMLIMFPLTNVFGNMTLKLCKVFGSVGAHGNISIDLHFTEGAIESSGLLDFLDPETPIEDPKLKF